MGVRLCGTLARRCSARLERLGRRDRLVALASTIPQDMGEARPFGPILRTPVLYLRPRRALYVYYDRTALSIAAHPGTAAPPVHPMRGHLAHGHVAVTDGGRPWFKGYQLAALPARVPPLRPLARFLRYLESAMPGAEATSRGSIAAHGWAVGARAPGTAARSRARGHPAVMASSG